MKSKGFYIQLDNPIRSYFPGQVISGRVVLALETSKDFKSISISFDGIANVHWSESRMVTRGTGSSQRTETQTVHFIAKENYFSCRIMLFGNDNGSVSLPAGNSAYPFQFTLPANLPSSYTSRIGMVHYSMEAKMKRSWLKADLTATVPFTVNGILDLNLEPGGVGQPVSYEKQKNVCCLFCKSGPVGYKVELQRTGFVPGEYITLQGEFTNFSRNKVNGVSLTLIQVANFHAQGSTRIETKIITSAHSPPIEAGESDHWGGEMFRVPPVPPTRLANCRIIDIQYYLKLEMDLSGLTTNLSVNIPVTIGTIPFRNTFVDFMPSAIPQQAAYNPLAPIPVAVGSGNNLPGYSGDIGFQIPPLMPPTAPAFSAYPDLPPPTYAEAIGSDRFEYNPTEVGGEGDQNLPSKKEGVQNQSSSGESSTPQPSAPSGLDYIPNYITYGYSHHNGPR